MCANANLTNIGSPISGRVILNMVVWLIVVVVVVLVVVIVVVVVVTVCAPVMSLKLRVQLSMLIYARRWKNSMNINTLNKKRRLLYLKTQFVPRSKHFSSRL